MAGVARNGGVCAEQREAILVILYLLGSNIPALHGVALFAVWTHLAAMDVRMAVCAVLSYICKDGLYVTLNALHFFVKATERILDRGSS